MFITLLSLLCIVAGVTCLALSLPPPQKKCDLEEKNRLAWRWLGALILLFLAGYLYYGFRILTHTTHLHDLFIALVLGSGGIFVITVVHLSRQTLNTGQRRASNRRNSKEREKT